MDSSSGRTYSPTGIRNYSIKSQNYSGKTSSPNIVGSGSSHSSQAYSPRSPTYNPKSPSYNLLQSSNLNKLLILFIFKF